VRTEADAVALLDAGAHRVVLGTAVVETPDLVASLGRRFPGRVAVGLDHRGPGRELAVRGWGHASATTLDDVLARLADVALGAVVVTAIDRDGTLEGPDVAGLRAALELTEHPVVASGGVRSAADLETLRRLRAGGRALAGAIVGTALVEGVMTVEEGIAACAPSG
jgi:phosphoribosylformimino-5-aminoimidazole carboxamide ribotide isomerase